MKDLDQLLSSLREHGTIDSAGEFTLSLAEARRKLTKFRSSDKARYLLLLVSGGLAAGATRVEILTQDSSFKIAFHQAGVAEAELLAAFEGKASSEAATDLMMGLQGAFDNRVERLALKVCAPKGSSYLWEMDRAGESNKPISSGGEFGIWLELRLTQGFRERLMGLLPFLRGYAGMAPEAQLVDQMCDRSRVPIFLDGQPVHRQQVLPRAGCYAAVGGLESPGPKMTEFPEYPWKAILALVPGPVHLVVFGVDYGQVDGTGFSGTVYCDHLQRDLSREQLVKNHLFDELLEQLEAVRVRLLQQLALELPDQGDECDALLGDLVELFLTGRLSDEAQQGVWNWMVDSLPRRAPKYSQEEFEPSPLGLMSLYDVLDPDLDSEAQMLGKMLSYCAASLRARLPRLVKLLERAAQLYSRRYPHDTLIRGYLLLGIGALHQREGRPSEGDKAWFKSLQEVWDGEDQRAQELIYLHMEYGVEHMLDQVAAALKMFAADLAREQATAVLA